MSCTPVKTPTAQLIIASKRCSTSSMGFGGPRDRLLPAFEFDAAVFFFLSLESESESESALSAVPVFFF
eukprot:1139574-Rhodomonas_salina.1